MAVLAAVLQVRAIFTQLRGTKTVSTRLGTRFGQGTLIMLVVLLAPTLVAGAVRRSSPMLEAKADPV